MREQDSTEATVTSITRAPSFEQQLAEAKARFKAAQSEEYAARRRAHQAQMDIEDLMDRIAGPLVD